MVVYAHFFSHFQIHIPIEQRISNTNAPLLSATHQLPLTDSTSLRVRRSPISEIVREETFKLHSSLLSCDSK